VFHQSQWTDPYAFAVSDVYQDLFGEGSYTGSVSTTSRCSKQLDHRIPESTLLSHDLLEGIFARAGLVSDIEVVEEFPARYDVAAARQHRWARGDWQLLPWVFGCGPQSEGDSARHKIPLLGRWKMLDNLRRTLSAPLVFLVGWMDAAAVGRGDWSAFVIATFAIPPASGSVGIVATARPSQRTHWRGGQRFHARVATSGRWSRSSRIRPG
jgi:cyclic beta-1,2-glucan synthetase